MRDISAIALFCHDIREEKSGTYSLIGVVGDNINVPGFPGAIPKFAIYVRIHVSVNWNPCEFDIFLNNSNGDRILVSKIEKELVEKTLYDAKLQGNNIGGIYSHLVASPFPIQKEGRFSLDLAWGTDSLYLGGVNFIKAEIGSDDEGAIFPTT